MSESEEDIYITQNKFSGVVFPTTELDEILGDVTGEFVYDNQSENQSQDKHDEQTSFKRGVVALNDAEVLARNAERIPLNTKKTTLWCLNVWDEWRMERNAVTENSADVGDRFGAVPSADCLHLCSDYELCFWLSKFVYEVRKRGGEEYPPNSLYQMCVGIQRYLRNNHRPEIEIFKHANFKLFQDAIDSQMKSLTRKGVGVTRKQAEPILPHEEDMMWAKGILGDADPRTLFNTLVFLFGKFFALRSGEEHRNLTFMQLNVVGGDETERERLQYRSHGEKNHGGGLKDRRVKPKVVEQHANVEQSERCVVRLYKKYVSKCPKNIKRSKVFYLTPIKNCKSESEVWYSKVPIGKNTLRNVVSNLCKEAGIEGYRTNHSLRATACPLALLKGVPDKLIMERTGHKSLTSLHTYQRATAKDKESVSDVLQGRKDCFMDEPITKKAKLDKSAKEGKPCHINLNNCSVVFKM